MIYEYKVRMIGESLDRERYINKCGRDGWKLISVSDSWFFFERTVKESDTEPEKCNIALADLSGAGQFHYKSNHGDIFSDVSPEMFAEFCFCPYCGKEIERIKKCQK